MRRSLPSVSMTTVAAFVSTSLLLLLLQSVSADQTAQCLESGVECTALAGECCDGLECIADINIATFSAELSCGERFGSCAVCGEGMVVGSPDADAQLPLPGFTFTCGQLEQAGQFGVFDTTLCQFIPNLISGICECIPDTDGGDDMDASDAPSMVPSSLVGADVPTLAPSVPSDEPGPSPETEAPSGSRSIVSTAMVVLSTTFVMMMISLTSSIQ